MSIVYGPKWPFYSCWDYIGLFGIGFIQVLYLGRAPRTKKTLLDFSEKCRVTRHSLVFRGLTGSQRTSGFWGYMMSPKTHYIINPLTTRHDSRKSGRVSLVRGALPKNHLSQSSTSEDIYMSKNGHLDPYNNTLQHTNYIP